jgi:hypothetical protein
VLLIVALGALGWVFSRSRRTEAPAPTRVPTEPPLPVETPAPTSAPAAYYLPDTPYTARSQYQRAEQAAREWQPDAALVSAGASWTFASLDDFSRPVDWTFQFYSPAAGRVYTINVDQRAVTAIRETLSPYELSVIDAELWQTDSYQALNTWLNRGGGAFLKQHPVVDVSARLARLEEEPPLWTIVGIDASGQAVRQERVDAR